MKRVVLGVVAAALGAGCSVTDREAASGPASAGMVASGMVDAGMVDAGMVDSGYDSLPQAVRSTPRPKDKANFGPPPPGYIKIVGEPVPDWTWGGAGQQRGLSPLSWTLIGPRPIVSEYWSGESNASGRIVSLAVHPTDGNIVYAASASGGIWKTVNNGGNWTPLTDELSILNHGHVALDPSDPDVVYAGTGEYTTGSSGDGLFRSTDAGAIWARIGTAAQVGNTCSGIAIDPSNPQIIHVTGSAGYVRSTNGGATWSTRLSGAASSLVLKAGSPNTLFVGRSGDGIYRSLDGGTTLVKLTAGLPTSDVRRIALAASISNPDAIYAAIVNAAAGLRGLYRTSDGGNTWIQKTATPNFPSPQGWYDAFVGVDPTNENIVYGGGVFPSYAVAGVIRSTNGGDSWADITVGTLGGQLHPDQHAIAFGPTGTVWVANDGGIWRTTNAGQSWINTNATLAVTQNYNIALHPTDPNRVMGGTQDNGTVGRTANILSWPQVLAGDGGFMAYDFVTPTRSYATYVYLTVYRLNPGNTTNISGPWNNDSRNFIAPLVMDPNNSRTLLGGTNRVWRTTTADGAATWTPISTSAVGAGGTLNAIAVATGAPNTIYTGSTSGRVFVTTDAADWANRSTGLPTGQISDIVIDPGASGTAYVSYYNTTGGRVFRTTNFGVSWTSMTGALPSGVSAGALAVDWVPNPPHLYVGAGSGVYSSLDGGATWVKDGADLPNVNIGDLAIDTVRRTITAGTYGRGAWRSNLPSLCRADFNGDGAVNVADFLAFISAYAAGDPGADFTGDGIVTVQDFLAFLSDYAAGCV